MELYLDLTNYFTNISYKERLLLCQVWKLIWQRERFCGSVPVKLCRVPKVRLRTNLQACLIVSSRMGHFITAELL